jgi:predicted nucleotidyltransferase
MEDFDRIVWPNLNEHYLDSLKEGTRWIIDNFNPSGIIVTGTIVRGNPDVSSDFDVFVIHNNNFRQRIQKIFKSIPFEIFVNPSSSIIKNIKDEYKTRMQCTSHMLATGYVLLNKSNIVNDLVTNAKSYLNKQPEYDEKQAEILRYKAAILLEDAIDIKDKDVGMANIFISDSVQAILDWFYYKEHLFMPRKKDLIVNTEEINYEIGKYARNVLESIHIEDKIDYLKRLADRTIMTYGFFEWESRREEVETEENK